MTTSTHRTQPVTTMSHEELNALTPTDPWLIDTYLDATYPPDVDPPAIPQGTLIELAAAEDGSADHRWRDLIEQRRHAATRALAILLPTMRERVIDEHARQQTAKAREQAAAAGARDEQPVARDTLRRWAVWCDHAAEYADRRLRPAATGIRYLGDQIRRELAHPADQPDRAPEAYRDETIFDQDRTEPVTPEGNGA